MVTILDGKLSRTWKFSVSGISHTINLFHDTVTGVRCGVLDGEEILGSFGYSPVLMDMSGGGHKIDFKIPGFYGYILISKDGWFGFKYSCFLNDTEVVEATSTIDTNQGLSSYVFSFISYDFSIDPSSSNKITWYLIEVGRKCDNIQTRIHRYTTRPERQNMLMLILFQAIQ